MLETVIFSFLLLLGFGGALALGQLFGRGPIKAKCNPDACCMQGEECNSVAQPEKGDV